MGTNSIDQGQKPSDASEEAKRPALQFDATRYVAELDQFDISEAQKQELLMVLWSIMQSFVELGFAVDVCTALSKDPTPMSFDSEVR